MRKPWLILSVACFIPLAAATSQRGGGGSASGGEEGRPARPQRPATVGQLEDLNPARMLGDKRKKLALVDSQVKNLKVLEQKIQDRNADLLTAWDSVRREIRFPGSGPTPGEMGASMGSGSRGGRGGRSGGGAGMGGSAGPMQTPEAAAKMRLQLQALGELGARLRERRAADLAESLAVLLPEQAAKAKEFVTEQEEEFDRLVPRGGRGG